MTKSYTPHPDLIAAMHRAGIDTTDMKRASELWNEHWRQMKRDCDAAVRANERAWRGNWGKTHFPNINHALFDIAMAVRLMPLQQFITAIGAPALPAPRKVLALPYYPN